MDEAERCHKLAYISNGLLLAQGTTAEVVAAQKLSAYEVSGANLSQLAKTLRGLPGVDQVTPFGNTLHVVGKDAQKLFETITPLQETAVHRWTPIEAGLEDVFINLMQQAPDNYAAKSP